VGYSPMFTALNLDNASRLTMGEIVTGNYFRVLGVSADIGRTIQPEDDVPGAPRVVMISHHYWTRELGSAADVIGRTLRLRGNPYIIIGVTASKFSGMVPVLSPELWIPVSASLEAEPIGMHDVVPSPTGTSRLDRRGDRWMFIRARLKPGSTIDRARASMNVLIARLNQTYPDTNRGRRLSLMATRDVHLQPSVDAVVVPVAAVLMTVVGLILLVACANVASMLLARASGRQKEIGIRLAIGASRGRLVRQLITEAMVMSIIGAIGGMLLAWWLTSGVGSLSLPLPIPLAFDLRIDTRVLIFASVVTFIAALLAGLVPAFQSSKPNVVADLRGELTVSRVAGRRWTLRDLLVTLQMAVTALLLVVAALLTRSLVAAQRTNVGFPVEKLAVVSTDTRMLRYDDVRSRQFYSQALDRVRAIPGVEAASLATRVPFSVNVNRWEIWVPERHRVGEHGDTIEVTRVSYDYFDTIGVPIVQGRAFNSGDRPGTPAVAIVNETMARRYWPNQSALGKQFRARGSDGPMFEVVGVSADHKVTTVSEAPTPFVHMSRDQQPNAYSAIIARTGGDASALLRDMRRELLALDANVVFVENQTMEAEMGATLFPVRASAWLVSIVGLVAMMLAAIGLYGVIACSVARRTREIGIRMALGAQRSSVIGLVMQEGLIVALVGLVAGSIVAVLLGRLIASALYGVGVADPISWLAAAAVLLGVSAFANLLPAWRAARVAPSDALRTE
jgi:predicted permease